MIYEKIKLYFIERCSRFLSTLTFSKFRRLRIGSLSLRISFGVSFDALLSDVNSSFAGREPNYTQDDLKNLRNYAFSIELGTKVKVMKNGYVTLGYRMTPKPFEIAFPNHISETGKHQINIGLVYDFK